MHRIIKEIFNEARRQNLTADDLAKRSNLSRQTIYYLKKDRNKNTGLRTIEALGKAFNLELTWRETNVK